jgi:hypothetical protein
LTRAKFERVEGYAATKVVQIWFLLANAVITRPAEGKIQDWVQVGFLGLKDVDEVDRLLKNQFARMEAQPV